MFPAATQAEVKLSRPPSSSGVSTMSISTQTKTKSPQHRRKVLLRPLYAGFEVVGLALNGEHQVVASWVIGSKHGNNRRQVDVALAQGAFGQSEQAAWQTAVA